MKNEISTRFKEVMIKIGISNKDIAVKCGITEIKVSDLRTGKNKISPELALQLEKYFKINPCWLIFGRGNMTIDDGFDLDGKDNKLMSYDELYKKVDELSDSVNEIKEKYGK